MLPSDLETRFSYHPATGEKTKAAHEQVRKLLGDAARTINGLIPEGREKAVCVTKLEEAMYWANAAIARSN